MVGIQTGVNHSDTSTAAGVTGFPYLGGAGHVGGNHHVGLSGLVAFCLGGIVAGFNDHLLNTGNRFNGLDLAIFHICRNQIGGKGQIPSNIQFLTQNIFDSGSHNCLLSLQIITVVHSLRIGRNLLRRETGLQGRHIPQND